MTPGVIRRHHQAMRLFIHLLAIWGLVLATVSPACAFISGQGSVIQICGADGHVKTIKVSAALDPTAPAPQDDKKQLQSLADECAFCFSFGTMKGNAATAFTIMPAPPAELFVRSGPGSIVFSSAPSLGFYSTGPPPAFFM